MSTKRSRHDIRVSSAILDADLTHGDKVVYIAIRSRQGANEWCTASQRQLAEDIDCNKSHINRSIKKLERRGWIVRSENKRRIKCLAEPHGGEYEPAESVRRERANEASDTPEQVRTGRTKRTQSSNGRGEGGDELSTQSSNERTQSSNTFVRNGATRTESQKRKPTFKTNNDSYESELGSEENASPGDSDADEDPTLSHPAVGIYRSVMHLTANREQRKLIAEAIDRSSTPQLEAWKAECRRVLRHGWKKTNVPGILERTNERLTREGYESLNLESLGKESYGDPRQNPARTFQRITEAARGA